MIFSPDSRFLARNTDKEMNIHQMPDMQLYKRPDQNEYTPFRFENGIAHYQFSPTANIVSVWTPQLHDSPSCLILINIETGQRLATRSRANFNAELIWQNQGDFLCSILSKKGKVKEGKELSAAKPKTLDVFRIREKNCPIETVDVDDYIKGRRSARKTVPSKRWSVDVDDYIKGMEVELEVVSLCRFGDGSYVEHGLM